MREISKERRTMYRKLAIAASGFALPLLLLLVAWLFDLFGTTLNPYIGYICAGLSFSLLYVIVYLLTIGERSPEAMREAEDRKLDR